MLDATGRIEQVDSVQSALVAGGDGDPVFGNLLDLDQVPLQRRDRHLSVLLLRLEQDDGANTVGIVRGGLGQRHSRRNGAVHRVLPSVVLGEHDRQLDHFLCLQLARCDAVHDVGVEPRRRGELDDGAGVHPCLHLARQAGVTAFCASSTIIRGRWRCIRLAKENFGLPLSSVSSPCRVVAGRVKWGSMSSLCA